MSAALIRAIAVTAELCGRTFTAPAAEVFAGDLASYPEPEVLRALARCRREVRGVLTTYDVVSRIDDGRPGVEVAWAMIPTDESQTVVWTHEMAEAFGLCSGILATGDRIGARMAFKEAYTALVLKARDEARPAAWCASLGTDTEGRRRALAAAVEAGHLTLEQAREDMPLLASPDWLALPAPAYGTGTHAAVEAKEKLRDLADHLRNGDRDGLAWARELRTMEQGGMTLPEASRKAWREALDKPNAQPGEAITFTPIPNDLLPPGMRKGAQ